MIKPAAPQPRIALEVVTDTAAGVRAAVAGGADRIELVSALGIGGVTPSPGLTRMAVETGCPIRVMIRPRGGDFTYDTDEIDLMCHDIAAAREAGAAGVVFGANQISGAFDEEALRVLCAEAAGWGLETALHRSFDLTPDPDEALDIAIELGVATILTSGGAKTAREGVAGLKRLMTRAAGRIEILAGIGVTADNVTDIVALSGVRSVHTSCSALVAAADGDDDRTWLINRLRAGQAITSANAVTTMRNTLNSIDYVFGEGGRA